MITIIALLLGLAVVALQLSSTQFSPRLLRNFLRDRPNQVVLSAFVATFAYSAAGLYTVGVSGGNRTAAFPRLAVSGAIVLLFASLGLLVFFADHLLHSIQVDAIMETVQRNTLAVIEDGLLTGGQEAPEVPAWAVPVASRRSGYVQAVRPGSAAAVRRPARRLPAPATQGRRAHRGRDDAGLDLAGLARRSRSGSAAFTRVLDSGVRIGFERTLEQDAAFGIRQLVDVACKALSPAVNDPYTAVQAVDHLSVIFCTLARRPLGTHVARDGQGVVIVPARRFGDYLAVMCGLIRRYGASEPTVAHALLRLLGNCAAVAGDDPGHGAAIAEQARLIVSDAEREVAQPADLDFTHAEAESVLQAVARAPQPGEPRAQPCYAGRRNRTRPAAVSRAPAAIATSHGAGFAGGCGAVPPNPAADGACRNYPAAHRVGHGVDLQARGVVEHHDGVNAVSGDCDRHGGALARRGETHGLDARRDRRLRRGRPEGKLPRENVRAVADRHPMLLQGGLEDPDDGLARRRGHLVLQHLGPQARIGAEGSQGVGGSRGYHEARGQRGLTGGRRAKAPHRYRVLNRDDRHVRRDGAVGDVF